MPLKLTATLGSVVAYPETVDLVEITFTQPVPITIEFARPTAQVIEFSRPQPITIVIDPRIGGE